MRINLLTPFAEKDQAKALGARWDAAKRIWYIVDVADLAPFARWIPDLEAAMQAAPAQGGSKAGANPAATPSSPSKPPEPATALAPLPCGCIVPPWAHCPHSGVD